MKFAWASILMCAMATTAAAKENRITQAKAAAKAWMAEIQRPEGAPAASAVTPILCWGITPVRACTCRGEEKIPTDAKQIRQCVQEQAKIGNAEVGSVTVGKVSDLQKEFGRMHRKEIAQAAKNTVIIDFNYLGDGEAATISVAVAPDRSIRAMWVSAYTFE